MKSYHTLKFLIYLNSEQDEEFEKNIIIYIQVFP